MLQQLYYNIELLSLFSLLDTGLRVFPMDIIIRLKCGPTREALAFK